MLVRNLGSGSGGNATVVAHGGRAVLIDAGLSRRRMLAGLGGLSLEGVLVTHVHRDHLGPRAQSLGAPVWLDAANARAAEARGQIDGGAEIFGGRPFRVGPFTVEPFALPHPGGERWTSHGFVIEHGRRRLAYATDMGHVPDHVIEALRRAHVVFIESNHDPEMEIGSGRPEETIEWVLSDHGHLSNEQCAEALARIGRPHTVILGHLSEDCNRQSLARRAAARALPAGTRLLLAGQDGAMPPVDV